MHISEGVLSASVLIPAAAIAACAVAVGFKKLPTEKLMTAGLAGAVFFVATLIHIPVGITSAHLVLNGLIGVLFGWASMPVIFCGLLLQALFFQFGGLTVLGLNTLTIGGGALLAGLVFHQIRSGSSSRRTLTIAGALAGLTGVLTSVCLTALALWLSNEVFSVAAAALFVSNLPVMVAEACLTALIVNALARTSPDLLK